VLVRKLEDKVRDLEMIQASVEDLPTPVLWVGHDGRFTYANRAAHDQLGYAAGDLIGVPVWLIDQSCSDGSWRASHWQPVEQHRVQSSPTRCTRSDGTTFPARITLNYWERGHDAHLIMFVEDMSAVRDLEQRIL